MKILFVLENYLPHIGGVETVFQNICEKLAAENHEIAIVTHRIKGTKKYEVLNGVKIYRVNCFHSRYLFTFWSIPKVLKLSKNYDIIHTTTFNAAFPAWIASKLRRKPSIITVHEVWVGKWKIFTDMNPINSFLHDTLEKFIYALKFDRYVCVSNSTKKSLMELKKTKKEKSRIEVIYNGLDYDHWNPDKYDGEKIRKQLNIAKKEFLLLCYGRPGPSKGIEYAISAMPKIVKKIPNARLLLILSKDKEYQKKYQELVELADNLKVSRSIIFHDSISYKDLPNYIKASDCVIVPSLSEGFGYAAAESCAMNIPVIATNNASLPEVVSGIYQLVPPKDSESIADAAVSIYRNEMMKKPIKRFEWADALKEYVKIYRKFK